MTKRIFIISILSLLTLSLFGCGGGNSSSSLPVGVNPGVASRVDLLATSYVNQTNSYCFLKTKVIDGNGMPVKGMEVIWTNLSTTGILSTTTSLTNEFGFASATVYSTTVGWATVQSEVNTGTEKIRDRKTIFFTPFDMVWSSPATPAGQVPTLTLTTDNPILLESASDNTALITATVRDANDNVVPNNLVTFSADSAWVQFQTLNPIRTDSTGTAAVQIQVSPNALTGSDTTVNITATAANGASDILTLFIKKITLSSISLAAAPASVATGQTSTITATVLTSAGTGVSGVNVNFRTTIGTITPFAATNASGLATATFTAPAAVGTASITGSVGGMSNSVLVTVTLPPAALAISLSAPDIQRSTNSGAVSFTVTGGVPPYTVVSSVVAIAYNGATNTGIWTGGSVGFSGIPSFSGAATIPPCVAAGQTTFTVTDSAAKTATVTFTTLAPPPVIVPAVASMCAVAGCPAGAPATLNIAVTGGATGLGGTTGPIQLIRTDVNTGTFALPAAFPFTMPASHQTTLDANPDFAAGATVVTLQGVDGCGTSSADATITVNN